eukprot:COSAG01_NODE_6249_length_3771_cov_8.185185_1_plen_72_part_10
MVDRVPPLRELTVPPDDVRAGGTSSSCGCGGARALHAVRRRRTCAGHGVEASRALRCASRLAMLLRAAAPAG